MNKKQYKQEYVRLIAKVTEILAKNDLIALIPEGFPKDEYSPETDLIVASLIDCHSITDVENLIADIYKKMFGKDYSIKNNKTYEQASDIFDAFKEYLRETNKSS